MEQVKYLNLTLFTFVGKSFVIEAIVTKVNEMLNDDGYKLRVMLGAPTGVAAMNIGWDCQLFNLLFRRFNCSQITEDKCGPSQWKIGRTNAKGLQSHETGL